METKTGYVVKTNESSLEELLAKGRAKLIEIEREKHEEENEFHADKLRAWQNALLPILEKWPWMVEYIEDNRYHLPCVGRFRMAFRYPKMAPIYFYINRLDIDESWKIEGAFFVPGIKPGLYPEWDFGYDTENIVEISIALAVAEKRGRMYTERMKAYDAEQKSIDKKQIEELELNESPEDRLIAVMKEFIQNEVCESCSRCS